MKIKNLIALAFVVLLWASLFGHTRLLGAVELYPIIGAMLIFAVDARNLIFTFVLGLLVGLIAVETIGLFSFAFIFAALVVLIVNRFTRILTQEMGYLAIILFLTVYKLTEVLGIYLLYSYIDANVWSVFFFVFSHFILAYILKYFLKPGEKSHSFIV